MIPQEPPVGHLAAYFDPRPAGFDYCTGVATQDCNGIHAANACKTTGLSANIVAASTFGAIEPDGELTSRQRQCARAPDATCIRFAEIKIDGVDVRWQQNHVGAQHVRPYWCDQMQRAPGAWNRSRNCRN